MGSDSEDPPAPDRVTRILEAVSAGRRDAHDELLALVYLELRQLAQARMRRESNDRTLQPTALVHEAYLRLLGGQPAAFHNRAHFFAAAAEAMRRVLIERARQHRAEKRGGARERVTLSGHDVAAEGDRDLDLLALDDALRKLEATDPRLAKVVSMRFFAQLGVEEVATALGVSPRTVKREWAFAKAWLYRELHGNDS